MTALRLVRRTQHRLALIALARAVGFAACIWYGGHALGLAVGIDLSVVYVTSAIAAFVMMLWRERFVWSSARVVLWIEEQLPTLRYALVTATDPTYAEKLGPIIEPVLSQIDSRRPVRRAATRTLLPLAAVAAVLITANVFLAGWAPLLGSESVVIPVRAGERVSRLTALEAVVTPPQYARAAGVETEKVDDPTTLSGLAGSHVEIVGRGTPGGISARLGETVLPPAQASGSRWRIRFVIGDSAAILSLADGPFRRLIAIGPNRDQPPVAQLITPARDMSMRAATGSLALDTRVTDDIGVAEAWFEFIISSGDSEGSFTAREGTLGKRAFAEPGRERRLRMVVPLARFQLKPGDQLSVRSAVMDNNRWNGPSIGYSEPRILRIPQPGEYDSLAVEAAPPPADSALMTLRYLIQLTERLHEGRRALPRGIFVDSSRALGARAQRLRFRVQQLQEERMMGRMFPPNPLLTTAYMALAEGEGALKVAEPHEALPHLWAALRVLQQFAWADRYYLRGRGGDVLVDLARVRLTGADTGKASSRSPRSPADTSRARMRRTFTSAIKQLRSNPDRAYALLVELQVEALRTDPRLAASLNDAVAALQSGGDARAALGTTRRLLEGRIVAHDTLPKWSGAW